MYNAKPELPSTQAADSVLHSRPTVDLGVGRAARHCATLLATLAGCLAIANLWLLPLTEYTLLAAGRGVIFLLLAIGLMGTARLSLFLALLVALTGLSTTNPGALASDLTTVLEACLSVSAGLALLCPRIGNAS